MLAAIDVSIKRKSTRLSCQNAASASSLSKSGTSSHVATAFIFASKSQFPASKTLDSQKITNMRKSATQNLIDLFLVEKLFLRRKRTRADHPDHLAVRPI